MLELRYNLIELILACLFAFMLGLGLMSFVVYWDQPKKEPESKQTTFIDIDTVYDFNTFEGGQFDIVEKKIELGEKEK